MHGVHVAPEHYRVPRKMENFEHRAEDLVEKESFSLWLDKANSKKLVAYSKESERQWPQTPVKFLIESNDGNWSTWPI